MNNSVTISFQVPTVIAEHPAFKTLLEKIYAHSVDCKFGLRVDTDDKEILLLSVLNQSLKQIDLDIITLG